MRRIGSTASPSGSQGVLKDGFRNNCNGESVLTQAKDVDHLNWG